MTLLHHDKAFDFQHGMRAFVLFPCGIIGNRGGNGFRVEIYGLDGVIDGKYGEFFYRGKHGNGFHPTRKRLRKETFGQFNHISVTSQAVVKRTYPSPLCFYACRGIYVYS